RGSRCASISSAAPRPRTSPTRASPSPTSTARSPATPTATAGRTCSPTRAKPITSSSRTTRSSTPGGRPGRWTSPSRCSGSTGAALPPGTEPDHPYYDYHPRTLTAGLFVREEWQATRPVRISKYEVPKSAVTVTADLAWRHQTYRMRGDVYGGVRFDQSYDFLLPRLGVTVVPRKDWTLFGAWSYASRQPRFIDLFNPEVAGSVPNY